IYTPERPCQSPHGLPHAASAEGGWTMTFEELLDQAIDMLRRRGRVTYRALKLHFQLDDDTLDVLKDELIYGQQLAVDEESRVLVWGGPPATPPADDSLSLVTQDVPPNQPHPVEHQNS